MSGTLEMVDVHERRQVTRCIFPEGFMRMKVNSLITMCNILKPIYSLIRKYCILGKSEFIFE